MSQISRFGIRGASNSQERPGTQFALYHPYCLCNEGLCFLRLSLEMNFHIIGAISSVPSPSESMLISSMVRIYSKPEKLPLGRSIKSLTDLSHYLKLMKGLTPQWPDDGSFKFAVFKRLPF